MHAKNAQKHAKIVKTQQNCAKMHNILQKIACKPKKFAQLEKLARRHPRQPLFASLVIQICRYLHYCAFFLNVQLSTFSVRVPGAP